MQAWPTCGDGAVHTLVGCEGRIILVTDPALAVGALIAITLKASVQSVPTGGAPQAQDTELLNRRVMSRQFIFWCLAPRWPTDFILLTLRRYLDFIPHRVKADQGQLLWEMLPACSHCLMSEVALDGLSPIFGK
jgi:hypothetical protein